MILEKDFECCYCGEPISFLLDLSVEFQSGTEDCEVCCQPIDFKYNSEEKGSFLRVRPLNMHGAPARGATVTLITNIRKHSKTIDAGSGYLCQMEPVAHYGIRKNETEFKFKVKWTNGDEDFFDVKNLNETIIVRQSK